jgi:hypothetical protein
MKTLLFFCPECRLFYKENDLQDTPLNIPAQMQHHLICPIHKIILGGICNDGE